jgi:pseudaminic acid biosynthesis-associated methylase
MMDKKFITDQEQFWAENFGDEYTCRNQGINIIRNNIALFTKIFSHTPQIHSVIEFGANTGQNLIAIRQLFPIVELSALEINKKAVASLKKIKNIKIYHKSILDFSPDYLRDFVLIKGVLIHLNPDFLPKAYDLLYQTSKRYICLAEYYNPHPVEVNYRGHSNRLFKRDFAGEMLEQFSDLKLIDYGFVYHRDNYFPQDDITWFILEKPSR